MSRSAADATPNASLTRLREAAGLTQQEVGAQVGVDANTVSRWERGIVTPGLSYRRALADLYGVTLEALDLHGRRDDAPTAPRRPEAPAPRPAQADIDPRVAHSQDDWRRTRRLLNGQRSALTQLAARTYGNSYRLDGTGLITQPDWVPAEPVDLAAVDLAYTPDAAEPILHGTEPETSHVRPLAALVRPYQRYSHAIREIERPRLFDNRASWRLTDLAWSTGKGRMEFSDTTYFNGVDMYEAAAHEMALVHLDETGAIRPGRPTMRDLPFRKLIGDPFDLARRAVLPSISTLTIRRSTNDASFILHQRDPKSVAIAGGMLQVIPSGVFQPSSVLPAAIRADFDLWRNIMREYSEELLGNPEHDGDGQPIRYDAEPFSELDQARAEGRLKVWCLGVALDALTLVGEILTVAVFDAEVFDEVARDFVDTNDEGSVINVRTAFTAEAVAELLRSGRVAPAGAGCIELAWRHRDTLLA